MFRLSRGSAGSNGSTGLFVVDCSRIGSKSVEDSGLWLVLTGISDENGTKSFGNLTCPLLSGAIESCRSTC